MAKVAGESPDPATPAAAASGGATGGDGAEGGAATLDDMAALMAEGASDDGGDGEPADPAADGGNADGDKPGDGEPPKEGEPKADGEPKEPEPPKDAKSETPEALRKGFAALARDRRKLQEREARAEAKVQAAAAFEQKAIAFDNVVRRLHEDPIGLLREAGGDALIDKALEGVVASAESPADREVKRLRQEMEARDKKAAQERQDQLVANWRAGIVREVQAGAEKYDLVNSLDMHDAVVEAITQYHIKHNAVLPTDVAAAHVEKALEAALSKSKKFSQRGAGNTPAPATPSRKTGATTTLSSVASGGDGSSAPSYPDDDDARFAAVLKEMAANGQLS